MENFSTVGATNISSIDINSANPIPLCQIERDYLLSYGFLIVKLNGGLLGMIQSNLMQMAIWILIIPALLTTAISFYYGSLYIATTSSLFQLIVYPFILIGLYKISLGISLYFSTKYMYISSNGNENAYIFGGEKQQVKWGTIIRYLKGEGWINNLNSDQRDAINSFSGLAILTLSYFLPITLFIIGLFLCGITIISKRNPLYAFGNLGEKIQKLTPKIAEKSKEIQKGFASDMSFQVLSDGFDGLASTFSQIVSLVIRLERVEARANKGNLFDSEKYISSLRSDIVGPLRSLRSFLDTRRTELTVSQQELSRVRVQVGGTSENRDLASARTEPLMREITENIYALDTMIGKMG